MRTPLIRVEKIEKEFGQGETLVQVLKGIDLEIYSGEYIIFFGPSGCGKSTLLNCIAGLEVPTKGKVVVRGQDISKLSKKELADYRNKKIGMIFQQFNVLKSFSVINNVALPQVFAGVPKGRRMKRAQHLLSMFGLEKIAKRLPTEISGGQQQRVAIARSLANNPWILIVDEPTGNLDSKASEEVMGLLEQLNKKSKRTIIMVTHNPEQLKYAHRIFYLKDGQIVKTEVKHHVADIDEKEIGEVQL
ncbi:MAG: ABC transporter ATP-binding protein [Patescibacteria group bacterium]|jgi:putative ABC transport system ATP-binding protein